MLILPRIDLFMAVFGYFFQFMMASSEAEFDLRVDAVRTSFSGSKVKVTQEWHENGLNSIPLTVTAACTYIIEVLVAVFELAAGFFGSLGNIR
jgi:hypothetical protein